MKIMMVEGRYTGEIDLSRINAGMLPERIGLITTVQFLDFIDDFKAFLERSKKKVFIGKERQKYNAQLLGCDQGAANSIKDDVDAYIYYGSGKFHPLGVVLATGKDVYCYDPINAIMGKVESEEAQRYNNQRKGAYLKFLDSEEIGLLVSLKPGQNNFNKALELKKRFSSKNFYIFAFDTLEFNQIENFPFVECWVNTACSRILDDYSKFPKPLIDIYDIEQNELMEANVEVNI